MRNQIVAMSAVLSALALATACSAPATGYIPPGQIDGDGDAGPPRKPLTSADASAPSDDEATCGGFPFNDKACGTCAASRCCETAATCMGDRECAALNTCLSACSDEACRDACVTDHARGVSALTDFASCIETKCSVACETTPPPPPPATKGIGDRCSADSDCRDGTCSGTPGWCTKSCTQNYDCKGYPQLNNEFAKFNYCLETASGGSSCFPGCSTNSDCTKYASGLTCQSAGNGVFVCSR